ncbi:TPA: hypothetical protein DEB04_02790 [Candidatus Giovannonibacteria bacterium]|nr:MAG: hypothetical protein A3D61_03450 [Candidatus Giovannonibacteria bacterium RIFCSPHIGHO2_02_FULL_48_15]OGF94526.1 MAG: hypothetical protein A2433_01315 [Candidatus Giovannonibacteria bacterium RIFOXYC1_FULL_48_8]OGF95833.1 MAG: hypothetical protein A2613_03355 [Candidatus Giovannonibacteria bacterium RIFOXYD1_FULL_48_21]HBT81620.1 hypothetical protein [Candidatus Giovannonibacteria bacterium]
MANQFLNKKITLVVFGATGDLMARKLAPSLFYLYKEKKLPKDFKIIGVSRRELSEEGFQKHLKAALVKYKDIVRDKKLSSFLKLFSFVRGFFDERYTYEDLKRVLDKKAEAFFYLAVAPGFYRPISHWLLKTNLVKKNDRLLVEKPFGLDLKSARSLDRLLAKCFREEQIYRIDHYLAKDGLRKLAAFRLSFEPISSIEIRLWETSGAQGRGEFYDSVGALRDVGQNHLLAMLAAALSSGRRKRARILEFLKPRASFRAQYRGYREIPKVKRNSRTETYFKITASLKGIGVSLESGKCLPETRKEVQINFHDGKKLIFPTELHKKKYQYVEEYETLLSEAFRGERAWFLSREEVFQMWRFVDPILKAWEKNKVPLKFYHPGEMP